MTHSSRIGLLGGTFNPIHIGHLIMAENALEQLRLEKVIFAPAGRPPHKADRDLASTRLRIDMIEMAIADRPEFTCSRIDSHDHEPSFTWRLLERLRDHIPGTDVSFILGGDSLQDFPDWARPDRILELARLAVVARPGYALDDNARRALPQLNDRLDIIETPMCAISSTEIRERVAARQSIRYLVPQPVQSFIEEHQLYRTGE